MIIGDCFVIKFDLKNAKKCLFGKVPYASTWLLKRDARLFVGLKLKIYIEPAHFIMESVDTSLCTVEIND
jgi:hypothetical protein